MKIVTMNQLRIPLAKNGGSFVWRRVGNGVVSIDEGRERSHEGVQHKQGTDHMKG